MIIVKVSLFKVLCSLSIVKGNGRLNNLQKNPKLIGHLAMEGNFRCEKSLNYLHTPHATLFIRPPVHYSRLSNNWVPWCVVHVFIGFSICDSINTSTHRPINKSERNQIIQLDSKGNQSEKVCFCCLDRKKRWGVEIDSKGGKWAEMAVKKHAHGSRKVFTVIKRSLKSSYDYVISSEAVQAAAPENSHFLSFSIFSFRSLDVRLKSFLTSPQGR